MKYDKALEKIKHLNFDEGTKFYSENGATIYLLRPSKKFKNYDVKKNFQIFLKEGERKFRPNHLRIMIDLNLRARSRPDLKRGLLKAFDDIFYGIDPLVAIRNIQSESFEHFLNPLGIIATLSQLFLIEQEYNYNQESNYEPATLFYQGWLRTFIDNSKEIDNLCMSVAKRQPPAEKYTRYENKKHTLFILHERHDLWYLNEDDNV